MLGPRFYVTQSEGYRSAGAGTYEHEYAVYDSLSTHAVAVFIASKSRNGDEKTWRDEKRENHLRARAHCAKLNREERELLAAWTLQNQQIDGLELLSAMPAPDAVSGVAGEAVEGLELNDLSRLRRGNDLAVPDVHDDMARPA